MRQDLLGRLTALAIRAKRGPMRRVASVVLMLVWSACAPRRPSTSRPAPLPVEIMSGPDGEPAAFIRCGEQAQACFRIAAQLCPEGYATHDRDKSLGPTHVESRGYSAPVGKSAVHSGSATAYTEQENTLFVSCPGVDQRRREIEARERAAWEERERVERAPKRCGYTCAPQPRVCPWLDDDGCYKPGFEPPAE